MSRKKKFLYVLVAVLVVIQFFRPARNTGNTETADSIIAPIEIQNILQTSCYDCHSNNTTYPWYTNVQPVGWWMAHHVNEGKHHLNFSEFESYPLKRKLKKLKEIKEQVEQGEMPISSYTLIHTNAKLTYDQKQALYKWTEDKMEYLVDTVPHK